MKHYCEDIEQVLQQTNSTKEGLTQEEAARRRFLGIFRPLLEDALSP